MDQVGWREKARASAPLPTRANQEVTMLDITQDTKNTSKQAVSKMEIDRMTKWLDERIARGAKEPHCEIVALTPALATLLLQRNPINRPIGRYNMGQLQSDVMNNRFVFNGESIVVSDSGNLIDGQHRCQTVIDSGKTITVVMVFGPKEEARYTIDIGRPKSAANFLHIKGHVDTNNLQAAISLLIRYAQKGEINDSDDRPTKPQIVEGAKRFKGIEASVSFVRESTRMKLGSRSAMAFCHYTFKKKSGAEAADYFIQKLIDGDGLRKGDPIFHTRDRLLKLDRGARAGVRIEVIFRGWNAWRRGETITSIRSQGRLPTLER